MQMLTTYSVPWHPAVVHFPIVLLFICAIFELAALFSKREWYSQAAFGFLAAGLVGLLLAAITGNYSAQLVGRIIDESLIAVHETLANITIWFYIFWTVVRGYIAIKKKKGQIVPNILNYVKYISVVAAIAGCVLIFLTAKEGGNLVFKKGVGTEMMQNGSSGVK